MYYEVKTEKPTFKPVEITLTFETRNELESFHHNHLRLERYTNSAYKDLYAKVGVLLGYTNPKD
jgi:hypothetical protein